MNTVCYNCNNKIIIGYINYYKINEKTYIKENNIIKLDPSVFYLEDRKYIGCNILINNKQFILTNSYTMGSSFATYQNIPFNPNQYYYYILISIDNSHLCTDYNYPVYLNLCSTIVFPKVINQASIEFQYSGPLNQISFAWPPPSTKNSNILYFNNNNMLFLNSIYFISIASSYFINMYLKLISIDNVGKTGMFEILYYDTNIPVGVQITLSNLSFYILYLFN